MKTKLTLIILMLCLSQILQAVKPKAKNNLFGMWKLVKAETNGRPNSQVMMDRTFKYSKDGAFEGRIMWQGEDQPFNSGMFFLPNDSTMICIHSTPDNKLSNVSYTYNFHVRNDSLHLYGAYFSNVQDKPTLLQMNFINEWWVKMPKSNKK